MAANTRNEWGINTLRRDQSGVIHGRADPEKEFQLLEKLGEGYVLSRLDGASADESLPLLVSLLVRLHDFCFTTH